MSLIDELLKEAAVEASEPVEAGEDDIETVAEFLNKAGELLKMGEELDVLPPIEGEQKPVGTEGEPDPTQVRKGEGPHVATNEDEPVEGEQEPVAPIKTSSLKSRILGLLLKQAGEGNPEVGLTAPEASSGLPESAEEIAEEPNVDIHEQNVTEPLEPVLENTPSLKEDLKGALPRAVEGEAKNAAYRDYLMGKISAHAFVQELGLIKNGGQQ